MILPASSVSCGGADIPSSLQVVDSSSNVVTNTVYAVMSPPLFGETFWAFIFSSFFCVGFIFLFVDTKDAQFLVPALRVA